MKKYIKQLIPQIAVRLIFHSIYIGAIAALPYIFKVMIDTDYADEGVMEWAVKLILLFIGCIGTGMLAQYITQRMAWRVECSFKKMIRKDLFTAIINKPPQIFREKNIGEYTSMLDNDVEEVGKYFDYYMDVFESVIGMVIYASYLLSMDLRVSLVVYFVAILTLFLPRCTGKGLAMQKSGLLSRNGMYISKVNDLLQGYGNLNKDNKDNVVKRHENESDKLEKARFSFGSYKTFVNVFNGSVLYLIDIATFVILIFLLASAQITVGVATATVAYLGDFSYPLRMLVDSISAIKSVSGAKKKLFTDIDLRYEKGHQIEFLQNICFENINLQYDNFCIKDFTYCFEKGKKYAIVGENGSGKSTLLKMLMGYITPDSGRIIIDGKEVKEIEICNVAGYVEQNSHVYAENFEDNITMFGSYVKDKYVQVQKWGIEDKLHTLCEKEDCAQISGGEKQITSLIRALLSERDILLLDEPCSAVDKMAEEKIADALLSIPNKTIIMVTHNTQPYFLEKFDEVICMRKESLV